MSVRKMAKRIWIRWYNRWNDPDKAACEFRIEDIQERDLPLGQVTLAPDMRFERLPYIRRHGIYPSGRRSNKDWEEVVAQREQERHVQPNF